MKASEIRDMTADELRRKVADLKQELFNLRFQLEVGQLENKAADSADQAGHRTADDGHP